MTKRNEYLNLASIEYYLIVSQAECLIDVYSKDEKGWRIASFSQLGDVVLFPSLGAQLALADIYEAVELGGDLGRVEEVLLVVFIFPN